MLSAAPQQAPQYTFKSAPPPPEVNHVAQPAVQQSSSASAYIPESGAEAAEEGYGGYGLQEEGLIYVPDMIFFLGIFGVCIFLLFVYVNDMGTFFCSFILLGDVLILAFVTWSVTAVTFKTVVLLVEKYYRK